MPQLDVEGFGTFDVPAGTRLVRALEMHGVDVLHRCGGYARCTTCRIEFLRGEPERMTVAEHNKLLDRNLAGHARLSCQILVNQDMVVRPLMLLRESELSDPGPAPKEELTPPPRWMNADE